MFTSGVSLNFLIIAPSIFTKSPTSFSIGTQDKKLILPEESAKVPRKISIVPLPSLLVIKSGLREIILAIKFT